MALDLDQLAMDLRVFAKERDWERFHNPKNLAAALAVEAAELLEQFQWLTADEAGPHATSEAVADEVADVLIYLARFADVAGVNLEDAVARKMRKNALKHPPPRPPAT